MADLFAEFRWRVPVSGFGWERGAYRTRFDRASRGGFTAGGTAIWFENDFAYSEAPTDFLVPRGADYASISNEMGYEGQESALPLIFSGASAREYAPLSEFPALFRDFAYLDESPGAFLHFANVYGALGSEGTCSFVHCSDGGTPTTDEPDGWGEAISAWFMESGTMHNGVAFWDAVRRKDEDFLSESIWYEEHDGWVLWKSLPRGFSSMRENWLSGPNYHPERQDEIRKGGISRAGLFIVQDLINEGMRARVHERLTWDDDRLVISLVPGNLIGALWLQFARAVAAETDFSQCVECGTWFEVAPGSGRPDKRYCSDACRMRAYRKRKAAATKRKKRAVR